MKRVVITAVGVVVALGVLAWWAREPVEALARSLVERGGVAGYFLAVVVGDAVPGVGFGAPMMVGVAGGVGWPTLLLTSCAASFVSSVLMWGVGRQLRGAEWIPSLLERARVAPLFRKHGARAMVIAAITPVPWCIATLGAGASGLPIGPLVAGAAARPIKIAVTLAVLAMGWRWNA